MIGQNTQSGSVALVTFGIGVSGESALIVNPLGEVKICSFDCVDCNLGPTEVRLTDLKKKEDWASVITIQDQFMAAAAQLMKSHPRNEPISVILSGNGEPTLYPKFFDLVKTLHSTAADMGQRVRLMLMTNGAHLGEKHVRSALPLIEEIFIKFEWTSEEQFAALARPKVRIRLEDVVSLGATAKNVSLQVVVKGSSWQSQLRDQFAEWSELVQLTRPKRILLTRGIHPSESPSEDELHVLAHWIERKLQLKVLVADSHSRASAA